MLGYAAPPRVPWRSVMRHFPLPDRAVAALPSSMMSGTAARALIARTSPPQRLATANPRTLPGAVDVPVIATPADAHLHRTAATVVEPVGRLPQTPHDPPPQRHWTAPGEAGIKGLPTTPTKALSTEGPGVRRQSNDPGLRLSALSITEPCASGTLAHSAAPSIGIDESHSARPAAGQTALRLRRCTGG